MPYVAHVSKYLDRNADSILEHTFTYKRIDGKDLGVASVCKWGDTELAPDQPMSRPPWTRCYATAETHTLLVDVSKTLTTKYGLSVKVGARDFAADKVGKCGMLTDFNVYLELASP